MAYSKKSTAKTADFEERVADGLGNGFDKLMTDSNTHNVKILEILGAPAKVDHQVTGIAKNDFVEAAESIRLHQLEEIGKGNIECIEATVGDIAAVGTMLHCKLMEIPGIEGHEDLVVASVINNFQTTAAFRLEHGSDNTHSYSKVSSGDGNRAIESTMDEARDLIRRSAISYGLIGGLAAGALLALEEDD